MIAQDVLQAIEKIGFQPAIRRKSLIPSFSGNWVRVPRGNGGADLHYGSARGSSAHLGSTLIVAAVEVIQGTISDGGETFQRRKTASAGRLQFLEPLFDHRLRLWKRTLVGHALSAAATNKQYGDDGQSTADRRRHTQITFGPGSEALHGSGSSCPRLIQPCWPSVVSTPYQYGVTIRITTSAPASRDLTLVALWNGADFNWPPGALTTRSA